MYDCCGLYTYDWRYMYDCCGLNTYDEKCVYVVVFGLHMLERYVFVALAYKGNRMLMYL